MIIVSDSRNVTKLNLTSALETSRLVSFTRYAGLLGNGVAAIDLSSRGGAVYSSYNEGGNWYRDLFIESSSFALSTIAGAVIVKGGLTLLLAATPVGWVALVVGGLAVVGIATAGSFAANKLVKENSGLVYDGLMGWLSP